MTDPVPAPRRPWLAALLNLLLTGFGSFYSGDPRRVAIAAAVYLVVTAVSVFAILFGPPSLGILLLVLIVALANLLTQGTLGWRSARSAASPFVPTRWNKWHWYLVYATAAWGLFGWAVPKAVRTYAFKAYRIPSESMQPTLMMGDYLFVDRRSSARRPVLDGLVTFLSIEEPGLEVIKRIVALPGDTIEMKRGRLLRNGVQESEERSGGEQVADSSDTPYLEAVRRWSLPLLLGAANGYAPDPYNWGPINVPEGQVFMLGDNRRRSWDSRYYGPVPVENLTGRPRLIYWNAYYLLPGMFARVGSEPK